MNAKQNRLEGGKQLHIVDPPIPEDEKPIPRPTNITEAWNYFRHRKSGCKASVKFNNDIDQFIVKCKVTDEDEDGWDQKIVKDLELELTQEEKNDKILFVAQKAWDWRNRINPNADCYIDPVE